MNRYALCRSYSNRRIQFSLSGQLLKCNPRLTDSTSLCGSLFVSFGQRFKHDQWQLKAKPFSQRLNFRGSITVEGAVGHS